MVIVPCAMVHTLGMRFSLDVVFLTADWSVLAVRHAVKPWRMTGHWGAAMTMELCAGEANRLAIVQGDSLEWQDGYA